MFAELNRFTLKVLTTFFLLIASFNIFSQDTLVVLPRTKFYDMYAETVQDTTPANVIRYKNFLVATKISDSVLDKLTSNLIIQAKCNALCDNYDRLGNINLVFTPKHTKAYNVDSVQRVELGRFITPFMYMGRDPKFVYYEYYLDEIASFLSNPNNRSLYDFWIELEIFGVPYAAQKEVKGCEGRNDVYEGEVRFILNNQSQTDFKRVNFVLPIANRTMVNNYNLKNTDTIGKTSKTFNFTLTKKLKNPNLYIITSNHGANERGEEYVRRMHYFKMDGQDAIRYMPGGKSCEPYRKVNTQPNGIYERQPLTDSNWVSWNNWCPGDAVPIRIVHLKKLKKGIHQIYFTVPDAKFEGNEGYFPVSLYLTGRIKSKKK